MVRPVALRAPLNDRSVARHAGANPNRKLVIKVIAAVNASTRPSTPTEKGSGPVSTPIVMRTSSSLASGAIARPTMAARVASNRLSVSSWLMIRPRLAPIERRTAISRCRDVARASSRFAVFAQAISSSKPTIAISAKSGARNRSRNADEPLAKGSITRCRSSVSLRCSGSVS